MSLTPIFDATLADAPANIWQASSIFPRPMFVIPKALVGDPDYRDWSFIRGIPVLRSVG